MRRHTATGTSSVTGSSPARRKARAEARRREEQRWAAMAGPVTVTSIDSKGNES